MRATLLKLCEMSWASLAQLKRWMKHSASFNLFDVASFNNPNLQIAQAWNERGEVIALSPVENVLLVSAYAVNPTATQSEAQTAGDEIDAEIAAFAQRNGVSKMLLVVPADHPPLDGEWKHVRVYERPIDRSPTLGVVGYNSTSPSKFVIN